MKTINTSLIQYANSSLKERLKETELPNLYKMVTQQIQKRKRT